MSSRRLQGTSGSTWFNGESNEFCSWHGVGCESNCVSACDVTTLDMYDNNLGGTIPTQIGNLVALVSLDFSGNNLTGSIPEELGNLANLDILTIDGNDFDIGTTVPEEICDLGLSQLITDCDNQYFVVCSCCTACGDQVAPSESPSFVPTLTHIPSEIPVCVCTIFFNKASFFLTYKR